MTIMKRQAFFDVAMAYENGNGDHTSGCLLPGDAFEYDERVNDYKIKNSTTKKDELFRFFSNYGRNGIKINIGL